MNEKMKQSLSRTDKLCLAALAGLLVTVTVYYEMTEGAAIRSADADKSPAEVVAVAPPIDCTRLSEAVEAMRADQYDDSIPLDRELQTVLREACEEYGVPLCNALGLIEVESGFQVDAISREGCFGLFQLNPKYYPSDLTPAENIQAGVAHLAGQIARYDGDIPAALRSYNRGYDDGDRAYARKVMEASEKWRNL